MTQQVVHAKVTFPGDATFEDTASIGLTFEATGSDPGITTSDMTTQIEAFFNSVETGMAQAVCHYMSPGISRVANAISIAYTDVTAALDGSVVGSPFALASFTLGASAGGVGLPNQVAITVGYRAAYGATTEHGLSAAIPTDARARHEGAPATHAGTTRPRSSDRGRFYLGPLSGACLDSDPGRVIAGAATDIQIAANGLFSTHAAGLHNQLNSVVWSRRQAEVRPVSFFYIDEGFTTIRLRQDTTIDRVHSWVGTSL